MVDSAHPPAPLHGTERPLIPSRRPPRRGPFGVGARWPLIVGASILMGIAVVFATVGPTVSPTQSPVTRPPVSISSGYLVSVPELLARADLARAGEQPYADAVADLMVDAERLLGHVAQPIQPLLIEDDGGIFEADGTAAYGLAIAFRISADERYGRHAADILRAWVGGVSAVVDTCPNSGDCHTTLIVSRLGAAFVFAADLLGGASFWTTADRAELADWLQRIILPAASERINNWGDAGTLLRVAVTDFVGDDAGFARALNHWRGLMDLVQADGSIPEEVRRGSLGLQYTQEALQYKIAVAEIAGRRGIDLWSYKGSAGGTLRAAMDTLARYWFAPGDWPYGTDEIVVPRPGAVWELAYSRWLEPAWVPIVTARRPYGNLGHSALRWTTLTNGIPTTLVAGPMSSPSPEPTPSASPPPQVASDPRLRLASVPIDGRVEVGLAWPLARSDGAGEIAIRIEISPDGGAFEAVAASTPAGREVVVVFPVGPTVRMRAAVLDLSGTPMAWVDGPSVVVRIHDDTDPAFSFAGAWSAAGFADYVGGSAASSSTAGATATVTVDAYAAMVVGAAGATRGLVGVSIDGADAGDVDLRAPKFDPATPVVTVSWSSAGQHTMLLEVRGAPAARPTVGLDAVITIEAAR